MAFPTLKASGSTAEAIIAPNLPQHGRGSSAVFEIDFFDDAPTNTVPAVPANSSLYPSFAIADPSGVTVATGVGIAGSAAGRWQTTWVVPVDATLSTQSSKWKVVWTMVTSAARQLQT